MSVEFGNSRSSVVLTKEVNGTITITSWTYYQYDDFDIQTNLTEEETQQLIDWVKSIS